jgi:hypothetical protein
MILLFEGMCVPAGDSPGFALVAEDGRPMGVLD